jgi:hypothetical protein
MTTFDIMEQLLKEMGLKWEYYHHSSGSEIVIKHGPESDVVIFGGNPVKLMLFDRIEKVNMCSKEIDLHHPNSIPEIKDLLFGWFKK